MEGEKIYSHSYGDEDIPGTYIDIWRENEFYVLVIEQHCEGPPRKVSIVEPNLQVVKTTVTENSGEHLFEQKTTIVTRLTVPSATSMDKWYRIEYPK